MIKVCFTAVLLMVGCVGAAPVRQGDGGDEGHRGEVEGAERDRQGGVDGQGCLRQGPVRKDVWKGREGGGGGIDISPHVT